MSAENPDQKVYVYAVFSSLSFDSYVPFHGSREEWTSEMRAFSLVLRCGRAPDCTAQRAQ